MSPDNSVLDAFNRILETTTGLKTPESNFPHLRRVIAHEGAAVGLTGPELLTACRTDEAVLQRIINAAMIGETYFFREANQFLYLRDQWLPALVRNRREVTGWSASCSTGEEAISLAAVMDGAFRAGSGGSFSVFASDVKTDALSRIAEGRYPRSALRRDGADFHAAFLHDYASEEGERDIRIHPALLQKIIPVRLNLFLDSLDAIPDDLDVVFFRNTLIYAEKENREAIISRIVSKVRAGGLLFFATSEVPFVVHTELNLLEFAGGYCFIRTGAVAEPVSEPVAQADGPAPGDAVETADVSSVAQRIDAIIADDANTDEAGTLSDTVARSIVSLYRFLNADDLPGAADSLAVLERLAPDSAITRFCTGWYFYSTGDHEKAAGEFTAAVERDPQFWPASFYRGLIHTELMPDRAIADFSRCLGGMDNLDESHPYRFFAGGFAQGYFRHLCNGWMEKLGAGRNETNMENRNGT